MEVSKVSLDKNYWRDNQYQQSLIKNAGVIVAFDWLNDKLIEINTNIDLGDFEIKYFNLITLKTSYKRIISCFGTRDDTISKSIR